jgi:uncharacterized membrane protein
MALVRSFRNALAVLAAAVFFPGIAAAAQESGARDGWKLCNKTSFIIEAAFGVPEEKDITVEGWLKLRPGECKVAVETPLEPKYHFLYARTSLAHRGGPREWGGRTELCVDPDRQFHAGESARMCPDGT